MSNPVDGTLEQVVASLRDSLRENLVSCCLYGSAARGNAVAGVSDLNVLIVLQESSAQAHAVIARALAGHPQIDPLVVAERNLERTARCFAAKFSSIKRQHRVLHGSDPLAAITIDPRLERLLCEQSMRNLRLRLAYAFIVRGRPEGYSRFLAGSVSALFINLAEILRLDGAEVPADFAARLPLLRRAWPAASGVLDDLLRLREKPRALDDSEAADCHQRVLGLLDAALATIESRWTDITPPSP